MAVFNKVNSFVEMVAEKAHNLGSDTLKVCLTNTAPNATSAVLADITQIATGNGYTAGGSAATITTSTQSGGTYTLTLGDVVFTATPGTIGPFQYIVLYNDTATNKELIGYYNYSSAVTVTTGNTFTVDFSSGGGVLTIA